MTYQTDHGQEVSDARNLIQDRNGRWVLGQADMADTQAGPPMAASQWAISFWANYQGLRNGVLAEANAMLDGTEAGSGAFQSVVNALGHTDNVANEIRNGDTSKAAQLLGIMSSIIRALRPEVQPGFLGSLENLLRGIPKNLQDAVAFAAEQGSQALQTVAGSSAGKVVFGLAILGGGLLALSYSSSIMRGINSLFGTHAERRRASALRRAAED
jgi:hypothetical protein